MLPRFWKKIENINKYGGIHIPKSEKELNDLLLIEDVKE